MSTYPYDKQTGANHEKVLQLCHELAYELTFLYEPFGQSRSCLEDGSPEKMFLGIRAFLSVVENLQMMEDLGDKMLETLVTLGVVEEREKLMKTGSDHTTDTWEKVIAEIKKVDKRTYEVIMNNVDKDDLLQKLRKNEGVTTLTEWAEKNKTDLGDGQGYHYNVDDLQMFVDQQEGKKWDGLKEDLSGDRDGVKWIPQGIMVQFIKDYVKE